MGGDEMRHMGTIEKDRGSPFGMSANEAYSSTPNIKIRENLERPTSDREGIIMYRNTTEVDEIYGYKDNVTPGDKKDHQIPPIEIDDDDEDNLNNNEIGRTKDSGRSNSFKIPPRDSI